MFVAAPADAHRAFAQIAQPRDAQTPATGTGVIAGIVTSAESDRPVRRARVVIRSNETRTVRSLLSDDHGRFVFGELPAGHFVVTASKYGYLETAYGQKSAGTQKPGAPIALASGQRVGNVALRLPRAGVIAGTVVDEFGDGALAAKVSAMRIVMQRRARGDRRRQRGHRRSRRVSHSGAVSRPVRGDGAAARRRGRCPGERTALARARLVQSSTPRDGSWFAASYRDGIGSRSAAPGSGR